MDNIKLTIYLLSTIFVSFFVVSGSRSNKNSCPQIHGCHCSHESTRVKCRLNRSNVKYFQCESSWTSLTVTVEDGQETYDRMSFMACSNLTVLTVMASKFSTLRSDKFSKLYKLKTFIIKQCDLTTIETKAFRGFISLDRIMIRDNSNLKSLPGDLFESCQVREVIITGNALELIESNTFNQKFLICCLEKLDLSHNRIMSVDPNAFKDLRKLALLDLSSNRLELLLSSTIPTAVSILKLSNNQIQTVTTLDSLRNSLTSLDLENNEIDSLIALPTFVKLKTLNLVDNMLTEFPPSRQWKRFGQLETLSIKGNAFSCVPIGSLPKKVKLIQFKRCDKGPREPRNQESNTQLLADHPAGQEEYRGGGGGGDGSGGITKETQFKIIIGVVSSCLAVSCILLFAFVYRLKRRPRGESESAASPPPCKSVEKHRQDDSADTPLTVQIDNLTFSTPIREGSVFSSRPTASNLDSIIDTIPDSINVYEALGPESELL